ncbi:MAG: MFS transporter [Candidatus Nanoarchaeia archaeon]|nr:MFS transporter [Candidatus Nanoarchaeia archaeon]
MKKKWFNLSKDITLLGIVSFFTDISSEMIFSVFSIFFTIILGASAFLLGLVEGLSDLASSSLDYISGYLSDKAGKRKIYATIGYLFSTLSKGLLVISQTIYSAFFFRVVERFGKSFRGPPKDAWIASLSNGNNRGYAFALHKTFDKAGAIIGPLIAYFILDYFGQTLNAFKIIFLIALIPAILAVLILFFLKDKPSKPVKRENIFKAYKSFNKTLKNYVLIAGIFSIAYFSFSFLLLKSYLVGFQLKDIALLYSIFNLAFVFVSIPIGKLGDKIGRRKIVLFSYLIYAIMCLGFVYATTKLQVIGLFVLFGIFYTIDEGQTKAFISDLEAKKRGTAIGFYNFITGIVYLAASIIAGYLWTINPNYTFIFAALVAFISFILFFIKFLNKN